jgi:hypothetical protein
MVVWLLKPLYRQIYRQRQVHNKVTSATAVANFSILPLKIGRRWQTLTKFRNGFVLFDKAKLPRGCGLCGFGRLGATDGWRLLCRIGSSANAKAVNIKPQSNCCTRSNGQRQVN